MRKERANKRGRAAEGSDWSTVITSSVIEIFPSQSKKKRKRSRDSRLRKHIQVCFQKTERKKKERKKGEFRQKRKKEEKEEGRQ